MRNCTGDANDLRTLQVNNYNYYYSTATSSTSLTPELRLNDSEMDVHNSESTETVVRLAYIDKEKESLAFKLDRLNDIKCRYESHEAFLKKCLDNNLVPNGLKVYVEPSIGNRGKAFLQQWHSRLEDFSKTRTTDVIGYCENEISKTKNEIVEISERLKALVTTPVFTDISKTITINR